MLLLPKHKVILYILNIAISNSCRDRCTKSSSKDIVLLSILIIEKSTTSAENTNWKILLQINEV